MWNSAPVGPVGVCTVWPLAAPSTPIAAAYGVWMRRGAALSSGRLARDGVRGARGQVVQIPAGD